MIKEFKLPDLGEGLTESEIVSWHVAVGDTVVLNQVLGEVETAKAVVELPSPYEGVITALHEQPGTVVQVGEPIVSFDIASDGADDNAPQGKTEAAGAGAPAGDSAEPEAKRIPTLVGYGAEVEKTGRPQRRRRSVEASTTVLPAGGAARAAPAGSTGRAGSTGSAAVPVDRPRSTPPVRKLARDMGIDLASVRGTGTNGLIVRDDVMAAHTATTNPGASNPVDATADTAAAGTPAAVGGPGTVWESRTEREVRTPIKGVRKYTAAAMVASAFTAPHVTEFLTVDVTASMEFLERLKSSREFAGLKLTPLTLVAKALCIASARQPSVNSRWDEPNGEIVTMNYVNLGIAAATPRGLMVPNIKDAHEMTLKQLAISLAELTQTARDGKTTPKELNGGTISITNIGVFGIDAGTPILNPGEAAILAMGAVRRQPWEYQGGIALRQVMTLSLSFDHRLVDGEQGSKFLSDIGNILTDPGIVMTMV